MTALLESYVAGKWFRADADGEPLLDAATGDEVARISSRGVDLQAMVDHARNVGGPAIRAMTFHERAGLLRALAKHLSDPATGIKDELYALSTRTGATTRDSMVDIDGGFGTALQLRQQGRTGTAQRHDRARRLAGAARSRWDVRRPASLHVPARRRGADQRLQLPGVGDAREARPGLPGRAAEHRQAGQPDRLPHRGRRAPDHRVRHPARGCAAAAGGQRGRPARPARGPGLGRLHRVGAHGGDPAHAPVGPARRCHASGSRRTR